MDRQVGPRDGTTPPRGGRLECVDVLRALAALAVLFAHIPHYAREPRGVALELAFLPLDFGYLGVTLFLVISGFCIHLAVARRMGAGREVHTRWVSFWRRRFYRLYPPYLAAIALSLLVYYGLVAAGRESVVVENQRISRLNWDLLAHLLLVQNLSADYLVNLGNAALWTLGLEEQLYALYAVYLLMRRDGPAPRVLLAVFAVSAVWKLGPAVPTLFGSAAGLDPPGEEPISHFWPFAHWFAWVLGAVAAEAHAGVTPLPAWCRSYRVAAAAAFLWVSTNHRSLGAWAWGDWLAGRVDPVPFRVAALFLGKVSDFFLAAAAFVVLNRWTAVERGGRFRGPWVRPLALVGLMSYSLYLTHIPMIHLGDGLLGLDDNPVSTAVRYAVYVPGCLAFAAVFFWGVERHFLHPRPAPGAARAAVPQGSS